MQEKDPAKLLKKAQQHLKVVDPLPTATFLLNTRAVDVKGPNKGAYCPPVTTSPHKELAVFFPHECGATTGYVRCFTGVQPNNNPLHKLESIFRPSNASTMHIVPHKPTSGVGSCLDMDENDEFLAKTKYQNEMHDFCATHVDSSQVLRPKDPTSTKNTFIMTVPKGAKSIAFCSASRTADQYFVEQILKKVKAGDALNSMTAKYKGRWGTAFVFCGLD